MKFKKNNKFFYLMENEKREVVYSNDPTFLKKLEFDHYFRENDGILSKVVLGEDEGCEWDINDSLQRLFSRFEESFDKPMKTYSNYSWDNTPDRRKPTDINSVMDRKSNKLRKDTIDIIHKMIKDKRLKDDFTILELFCGDGGAIGNISKQFPDCNAFATDMFKFGAWDAITDVYGVQFFQSDFFSRQGLSAIPNLSETFPLGREIDIIVTYNTYRGWDAGPGPGNKKNQDYSANDFNGWLIQNDIKYFGTNFNSSPQHQLKDIQGDWKLREGNDIIVSVSPKTWSNR